MAVKKKTRLIESLKQRISLLLEKVDSTDNVSKLSKILDKEKAKRNKKLMSRIHKAVGYNKQFKKSAETSAKTLKNVKDQPPASSSTKALPAPAERKLLPAPATKKPEKKSVDNTVTKKTVNKTTGADYSKQSGNRAKDSASAFTPLFKKEDAAKKKASVAYKKTQDTKKKSMKSAYQAAHGGRVGKQKIEQKKSGIDAVKADLGKIAARGEKKQGLKAQQSQRRFERSKSENQRLGSIDNQLATRRKMTVSGDRNIMKDKSASKAARLGAIKRLRQMKKSGMDISAAITKMWGRLFESGTSEGAKKAWETRRKHGSLRHLIKLKTLPKRAAAAKKTEPKKVTKAVKAVVKTQPRKPTVTKAVKAVVKTNNKYLAKALTGKQSQALANEVGGWSSEMALFGMLKDMGVMNNPQIGKHNKDIETEDGKKIKYTIASNDKRYIYTRSILGGRQQLLKWHKELGMNLPKGFENYSPEQITDYFYYFEANKDRLMKKWTKEDRRGRPPKGGYVSNKHL